MNTMHRRSFLKAIGAISSVPVWSRLASASAFASVTATGGYKAAVCIALRGGNDANNLIVPLDRAAYAAYSGARGALSLPYAELLPLGTNASYGLHPALMSVQALYNQGKASIVAGIGALHAPVTKVEIVAGRANLPELFNHPAGQLEWESGTVNASSAQGWGGRVVDVLSARSGSLPGVISLAGNSLFMIGSQSPGYTIAQTSYYLPGLPENFGLASAALAAEDTKSPVALVRSAARVRSNMVSNQAIVSNALAAGASLKTAFPKTPLGTNLSSVARMIAGRNVIGGDRQMFFCQQGGFDTHTEQLSAQLANLQQLDSGIGAFYAAMQELGLADQVLLFTISDFSRTYQPNTANGTDHAWSSHQIVVGGSGGHILGTMPSGELGGGDDMDNQGVWIPTTSSVQLAAGVAGWLGVHKASIVSIFPDLGNFTSGALSL
jgi:uncharacterized protein (DUF1501 family)